MLRRLFRRDALVRDLRTVTLAVIAASVVMATPSVAARLINADTVDGKSAVSSNVSKSARAGKLVATNRKGLLPNNIIKKAPDADKLDGLDSKALVARVAKRGHTQTGAYSAWGGGSAYVSDSVNFRSTLPVAIPAGRITFVRGGAFTTECPAVGTVVPKGWACIYEGGFSSTTLGQVFRPDIQGVGVQPFGFGIYFNCSAADCWSFGTWAVKAGTAVDIPRSSVGGKRSTP